MTYRILTQQSPPVTFLYGDAERTLRKARTLQRNGIAFDLFDHDNRSMSVRDLVERD
jgi:hypothetical protein